MRRSVRTASAVVLLAIVGGCKKREDVVTSGPAAPPTVDVSADRALARKSWIVEIARDPAPLGALAQGSAGWGQLFEGDAGAALASFDDALKGAAPDSPVRLGAARAALELADAHRAIAELVVALTPDYVKVVEGRPDAQRSPELLGWSRFVAARHAQATAGDGAAHWKAIDATAPAAAWRELALGQGDAAAVALLGGAAAGADAEPPAGGTPSFTRRLQLAALVAGGRGADARRVLAQIDAQEPDVVVGEGEHAVGLRDPAVAGAIARAYALQAFDALQGATGWAPLWRARAELALGRAADAARTLEALLKAPPERATLAELVLGGALGVDELAAEAGALQVRALAEAGQADAARSALARIPLSTVAQRVSRTWAGTYVGEKVDPQAFPEDRTVLTRALGEELAALGAGAPGAADVAALSLVDRYADQVQRRFADALVRGGEDALGLKVREDAEDKANAFGPSARNRLPALASAARDNFALGRPRVALKYLTRLAERLPEVAGAADMLRDLLTVRAMDVDGSATAGQ